MKEDQDIYYLHSNRAFGNKMMQKCDLRMLKKDGSVVWVNLATTTVKSAEGFKVCRIVMNDISERRHAGEILLEQEKLQGVLEMAGAICHELNQPLQVVSGSFEILLMDIDSCDPKYKVIKNIEVGVNRIAMLMRKIMGITHYQSKPYLKSKIIDIDQASQH